MCASFPPCLFFSLSRGVRRRARMVGSGLTGCPLKQQQQISLSRGARTHARGSYPQAESWLTGTVRYARPYRVVRA